MRARPFIIGVGGSQSGTGKTTVAETLLKSLVSSEVPGFASLKRWGAVKYTRTAFYSSLTCDTDLLAQPGKDTCRFLGAGAEQVLWIRCPAEALEEPVSTALDRLSHLDGIIIEGNSAIEFSNPDIVIFISSACGEMEKPSALRLVAHADIIVFRRGGMPHTTHKNIYSAGIVYFDPEDKTSKQELFEHMKKIIDNRVSGRVSF